MSKGHGWLQRAALKALADSDALTVLEIAWHCFEVEPDATGFIAITDAQRAAVARALTGLQKQGLAFAVHRTSRGGYLWSRRDVALGKIGRAVEVFGDTDGYGAALVRAHAQIA